VRIHKKQLLQIKKNNALEHKQAMELKRKIDAANQKQDHHSSIAGCIKDVVAEEGTNAFKFIGSQRKLTPKLKGIIAHLLNTD